MRLRSQLAAIATVSLIAVLTVFYVQRWSARRVEEFQAAQDRGMEILLQSRRVQSDLQSTMLNFLSPEGLNPVARTLLRPGVSTQQLESSIQDYSTAYQLFFENDRIRTLLRDPLLERKYEVTQLVGEKALEGLERIRSRLDLMEDRPQLPLDSLLSEFIVIDDATATSLMADVRYVSHFFTVTFERFLESFVGRLHRNADRLQQQALWIARVTSLTAMLLGIGLSVAFAGALTKRLRFFLGGVEALSQGDLELNLPEGRNDEIGVLLRRFNDVSHELARNIESITGLMTSVADRITQEPEFPPVLEIIGDATLEYTHAETVTLSTTNPAAQEVVLLTRSKPTGTGVATIRSWMDFALPTRVDPNLRMSVGTVRDHLSDLDVTHIRTFARYVVLLINHNDVYRELAERRQVAFEALQAQIQPHFLFNVLGGLFGLNRKGDQDGVERSVICLRDMMKYIVELSDTGQLSDEMQFVRNYLELQQIRFTGVLETSVHCHRDVAHMVVPRLILQPLVENAVVHGHADATTGATVTVSAVPFAGDRCRIIVADNGRGFDAGKYLTRTHHEESSAHIGLSNVQRRLAIRFPTSEFRIESEIDSGTTITIEVPVSTPCPDTPQAEDNRAPGDC